MAQCLAVGGAVIECAATMTDSNKRFGEVLSDEVYLDKANSKQMTQARSQLRKGCESADAGGTCSISVEPAC